MIQIQPLMTQIHGRYSLEDLAHLILVCIFVINSNILRDIQIKGTIVWE